MDHKKIFIVLKNNTSIIINKKPIIRDSVFLIISQLSLLLVLNIGEKEAQITLDESCFIILIYLIYLIYLSKGSLIKKKTESHKTNKNAWKNLILSLIPIAIGCAILVFACELNISRINCVLSIIDILSPHIFFIDL